MGNQPSTEAHSRRTPQKLSKPRVGNHTASSTSTQHPHPASASAPAVGQFSNPYLVLGAPPLESQQPGIAAPNGTSLEDAEPVTIAEERGRTGLFRSSTVESQKLSRRQSTGLTPSKTFHGIERPKAAGQNGQPSPLPSVASCEQLRPDRRAGTYNTIPLNQYRQSQTPEDVIIPSSVAIQGDLPDASPTTGSNQQAMNALLGRSQSEVSLYAPTRRRSAILTPGVATRSAVLSQTAEDPSVPRKKSHRKSLPSQNSSLERPATVRPRSMFPIPSPLCEVSDGAVTPLENDYKSLGAIRFGSLRVTNGTPVSSPGEAMLSREERTLRGPSHSVATATESDIPTIQQSETASLVATSPSQCISSASETDQSVSSSPIKGPEPDESGSVTPITQPSSWEENDAPLEMKCTSEKLRVTQQLVAGEPVRPVSGAGSKSSRSSSTGPPSKADSGYGSSLSLKSFFGSRKKKKQQQQQQQKAHQERDEEDAIQKEPVVQETRPILQHHSPYKPSAAQADAERAGPVSAPEEGSQLKSISRTGSFINSLKAKAATEPPKKLGHSRGASSPELPIRQESTEPEVAPIAVVENGEAKANTIVKLVNTARRRSIPTISGSSDECLERVPSMPSDAGAKVEEHSRNFEASTGRLALKVSPQMPKEIVVESREVDELTTNGPTNCGYHGLQKSLGSESMQQRGLSRTPSVLSARSLSSRRSILRRAKHDTDLRDDEADVFPDYVLGYEAQASSIDSIRRSAGDSAFDAAFAPLPPAHVPARPPRRSHAKPKAPESYGPHSYPRLRTRSSAPDFLETVSEPASPGSVSCYSQKQPKTPPPISIRTRGSKKKRRPKSARLPPPPMPLFNLRPPHAEPRMVDSEMDLVHTLRGYPILTSPQFEDPLARRDYYVPNVQRRPHAQPLGNLHISPRCEEPQQLRPLSAKQMPSFHRPGVKGPPGRVPHTNHPPLHRGVHI